MVQLIGSKIWQRPDLLTEGANSSRLAEASELSRAVGVRCSAAQSHRYPAVTGAVMDQAAEMVAAYRKQAILWGSCDERGDAQRGNAALARLLKLRIGLRELGRVGVVALLGLLEDDNVFVRVAAGIDALELSPDEGERVLSDIAAHPSGTASFEARETLRLWRTGEFEVPWWNA